MIKIGLVGATGYTGAELLRLLSQHPDAELITVTSRTEAGTPVADLFPNLRGKINVLFADPDAAPLEKCQLVFFAAPNGVAMHKAGSLLDKGVRIIDLSADFRIRDSAVWEKWYGMPHARPDLLGEAVYGLPEMHRAAIKTARLVANPGCYPTAIQLGFLPLIEAGVVDTASLIADAKSGVSGAGRKAELHLLYSEAADNFQAYAASGHRHWPEIIQGLSGVSTTPVELTFVPHLAPMLRGIHATLYAVMRSQVDIQALYEQRYSGEPFVDVLPAGGHPDTRSVRASNSCRMAIHLPDPGRVVVILSVIDNLVKGASGQAIQNMNIMFGLPENTGLDHIAVLP